MNMLSICKVSIWARKLRAEFSFTSLLCSFYPLVYFTKIPKIMAGNVGQMTCFHVSFDVTLSADFGIIKWT